MVSADYVCHITLLTLCCAMSYACSHALPFSAVTSSVGSTVCTVPTVPTVQHKVLRDVLDVLVENIANATAMAKLCFI